MSMPKFPEIDPEITCEHALNMILASIAMEELALSHIINAEGEKLQYVLGTLKSSCDSKYDIDEILKVNQSITNLLESALQNQMILKNKMDKALNALLEICPHPPKPPCPPKPPDIICKCPCKCSATFKAKDKCKLWCSGSALNWDIEHLHGKCVCYDLCDKTKIKLCAKGRFMVSFSVNVRAKDYKCNATISLQMLKNHKIKDIYTACGYIPCDNETVTISMSNIIVENFDYSSLSLKLESFDSLVVEDSALTIVEI